MDVEKKQMAHSPTEKKPGPLHAPHPGEINCNNCDQPFWSSDKRLIRKCKPCKTKMGQQLAEFYGRPLPETMTYGDIMSKKRQSTVGG